MARYEREKTTPVLASDAAGAKPDPSNVVARVGPDGKIQLGRLDLVPPAPAPSIDEDDADADAPEADAPEAPAQP